MLGQEQAQRPIHFGEQQRGGRRVHQGLAHPQDQRHWQRDGAALGLVGHLHVSRFVESSGIALPIVQRVQLRLFPAGRSGNRFRWWWREFPQNIHRQNINFIYLCNDVLIVWHRAMDPKGNVNR